MSDEPKNLFDILYKTVKSTIPKSKLDFTFSSMDMEDGEATGGKEFLAALASWAGKGKDEVVQLLCREIGVAIAAMLKEPVTQIIENRKLQITVDLVGKDQATGSKKTTSSKTKTKSRATPRSKTSKKKS